MDVLEKNQSEDVIKGIRNALSSPLLLTVTTVH